MNLLDVVNVLYCLKHNVPVVSGTTGWLEHYDEMVKLCNNEQGAFLYASNFSLGVNLFFELNRHLAKIMSQFKQYNAAIEEYLDKQEHFVEIKKKEEEDEKRREIERRMESLDAGEAETVSWDEVKERLYKKVNA